MPFKIADRLMETSTTTGTGTFTLAGAMVAYRALAVAGTDGTTIPYLIEAVDADGVPTGDWEIGIGTLGGSGTTLARTTFLASSTGSAVSFAAGTKKVSVCLSVRALETGLLPTNVAHVSSNQSVTAAQTGTLFIITANGVTFTLPTIAEGLIYRFLQTTDNNMTITGSSNIIHKGNAAATSVAFSTNSLKIGSYAMIEARDVGSGTLKWVLSNLGVTTATVS